MVMLGLYALKPWYTRLLGGIIDYAVAQRISPNFFTAVGVLGASGAAMSAAQGCWPLVSLCLAVRLAGANLDGAVARARGLERPWGFVVNEMGDRASDLVMFAGLLVWAARQSGDGFDWSSMAVVWVLVAALAAHLPTFASLAAAGAGATRRNGGPLGKTERCAAATLLVAAPSMIGWICATLIVGSVATAVMRLASAHRELSGRDEPRPRGRLVACTARHQLWRAVCAVSGGLTVRGKQRSGCILVANHSSHADTAVLLAALKPSAQPVFVAASDYWFDVPLRRFLATSLAGILPVRRSGGGTYAALLAATKAALAEGWTVVLYPEGTRSCDGRIGEFHSGAVHLARDCGVPLVPVALLGTREVLPKNGSFTRHPMQVRFGEPIDAALLTAEALRDEVVALAEVHPVGQAGV
jgi:CDP-diacylglycerol--glycerol-3-phosphate 3-phosphatidyltransferase